jgi:hypothetical protein
MSLSDSRVMTSFTWKPSTPVLSSGEGEIRTPDELPHTAFRVVLAQDFYYLLATST